MSSVVDYVCDVAVLIISLKMEGSVMYFCNSVGVCSLCPRACPMFMSAPVYCMRIPVCACAVAALERGVPHGLFKPERS